MQIVHKTIACVFYIDSPSDAIVIDSDEEGGIMTCFHWLECMCE